MASNSKKYGLIVPKKFNIDEVKRPTAVFNIESDSEDDSVVAGSSDWIKKSYQKLAAHSSGVSRQTEIDMKKALSEDPTVYEYDEIYDDMEKKKQEDIKKTRVDKKKPRYIEQLLKTAQNRKVENERRLERQVQKERETEGDQFKDKETFVTSAYKKKLEEFHKLDEEERRKDMLEDICDVSKQNDLGGFYRHLYKTTIGKDESEKKSDSKEVVVKTEKQDTEPVENVKKPRKENRQYRKRKTSESSSMEEGERNSDSDTSISSSSSSSSSGSASSSKSKNSNADIKINVSKEQPDSKKQKKDKENTGIKNSDIVDDLDKLHVKSNSQSSKNETNKEIEEKTTTNEDSKSTAEDGAEVKEQVKVNIWEKRTVGLVFEAALERYYKRKSERLANRGN